MLQQQLDELEAKEPGTRAGDAEALHDFRVATRRSRALLRPCSGVDELQREGILPMGASAPIDMAPAQFNFVGRQLVDVMESYDRVASFGVMVEDRSRGRLEGIGMAVWATGPALGDFESGAVATLTTPAISIVSGGLITIVGVGILRSFAPGFWRYDARHPTT